MNSGQINLGPAYMLSWDESAKKLAVIRPNENQVTWSKETLRDHTFEIILQAFSSSSETSPARYVYALAGRLFHQSTPYPIGGKKAPGYMTFRGTTPADLLFWLSAHVIIPPLMGRGHRTVEPGTCLRYCVERINEILQQERSGCKDDIDNAVLGGLTKCGHLNRSETGSLSIPHALRAGARRDFIHLLLVEEI
ncbi:hypothetical protein HDU97_004339 [Phlyctochytrium planicorne]|nr:hypothetical protein HDU97_004339 [Phlyctochytrium planicorne]